MNPVPPTAISADLAEDLANAIAAVRGAEPVAAERSAEDELGEMSTAGAELPANVPALLALCGVPRTGKDHLAGHLHRNYSGVIRLAYSTPIIAEVNAFLGADAADRGVAPHHIVEANKPLAHYRHLLQSWGLARRAEDPAYWTRQLAETLDRLVDSGARLVIVSGARVPSDLEPIRERGGQLWRVDRPDNDYEASHDVEAQITELPADRVLINPGPEHGGAFERAIELALTTDRPLHEAGITS